MADYRCSKCGLVLEHIGVPPAIRMAQMYGQIVNTSSDQVPAEVRSDPYLYRGFYCRACNSAFCPSCSNMQGEICTGCGSRQLMPAYRPLLMRLGAKIEATQATLRQPSNQPAVRQPSGQPSGREPSASPRKKAVSVGTPVTPADDLTTSIRSIQDLPWPDLCVVCGAESVSQRLPLWGRVEGREVLVPMCATHAAAWPRRRAVIGAVQTVVAWVTYSVAAGTAWIAISSLRPVLTWWVRWPVGLGAGFISWIVAALGLSILLDRAGIGRSPVEFRGVEAQSGSTRIRIVNAEVRNAMRRAMADHPVDTVAPAAPWAALWPPVEPLKNAAAASPYRQRLQREMQALPAAGEQGIRKAFANLGNDTRHWVHRARRCEGAADAIRDFLLALLAAYEAARTVEGVEFQPSPRGNFIAAPNLGVDIVLPQVVVPIVVLRRDESRYCCLYFRPED
jgi:hypothetical protein